MMRLPRRRGGTHGAELAGGDEDAPLVQHAGVQLQHVAHVHGHEVLGEVPLRARKTTVCALGRVGRTEENVLHS